MLAPLQSPSDLTWRQRNGSWRPAVGVATEEVAFHTQALEVSGTDMEIVSLLRRRLAEHLGQDRYDLWFGRGVRLEWQNGILSVIASDQFVLDRLKLRFRPDLTDLARQLVGDAPTIEFSVDASMRGGESTSNEAQCVIRSVTDNSPREVTSNNAPGPMPRTIQFDDRRPAALPRGSVVSRVNDGVKNDVSKAAGARRRFAEFDAFVVGDSNRVAVTAIDMTANRVGKISPLLVYGPSGCGKTHLLEALLMQVRRTGAVKRSVLISAEQFTTHFLEALRGSGLPNFRRKYRDVELLLIDDVQFFAGKRATLVELQHTLDTLLREGRQVVMTSDRAPVELAGLGTELTARMTGGLVCGIEAADYGTRFEIARRSAMARGLSCPTEVLELIARELSGDGRQIAGALNRLEAASHALKLPITFEFAQTQLADLFHAACRLVRLPDIERAICDVYGLGASSLQQSGKSKELNEPRMLAMWLARKYTRAAFSEIGQFFGRRSHSTVIAAHKRMVTMLESNAKTRVAHTPVALEDVVRRIEQRLRTGS